MYAMSDDRARSIGPRPIDGELPVLFHLMDVSRPRPIPPSDQREPVSTKPQVDSTPLSDGEAPLPAAAPSPFDIVPVNGSDSISISTPTSSPSLMERPQPVTEALPSSIPAPTTAALQPIAISDVDLTVPPTSSAETSETSSGETPTPPAKSQHPVTPRSQTASRRKPKTAASEDWFAAHGKFIAIAFVVALIGTIYFARTSRQQSTATTAATPSRSPATDRNVASDSPATTHAGSTAPAINTAAEVRLTTPAETITATSESKVDLHPPTAPQLVSGTPADDKPQGKDNLFVFPGPKSPDERVASRGEPTSTGASPASQQAAPARPAEVTPVARPNPPASQPALSPAYPTNSSPAPVYPVTSAGPASYPLTAAPPLVGPAPPARAVSPPPSGYPSMPPPSSNPPPNYRSQFPMSAGTIPPQPQAWSPSAPGGGLPGQSQPLDNTARGPRYERTGSGIY